MCKINLSLVRKNPLTIPVMIADKLELFKKHNVEVALNITEDFQFDGNQPFLEGKVDAMVGDLTFLFYLLEKGKNAVITSTLTRTINLVGKNYPKDLKGLKVGVNRAGLFSLFLENDLKDILSDTKIIYINNSYERIKALNNGCIDALVAIEPFISDITDHGGEVIWNSRDSDSNFVMWAFDKDFYHTNKEVVRKFHLALEESATIFNELSSEEKVKLTQKCAGYSKAAAKKLFDFEFEKQSNYSLGDFNICQEWMFKEDLISRRYDGNELIGNII